MDGVVLPGGGERRYRRLRAVLPGPADLSQVGSRGIDSIEALKQIPEGFDGYVWTNRIETVAPAL